MDNRGEACVVVVKEKVRMGFSVCGRGWWCWFVAEDE